MNIAHIVFFIILFLWTGFDAYLFFFHNRRRNRQYGEKISKYIMLAFIIIGLTCVIFFDSEAQKAFTAPFVCHRFSGCVLMCVCVLLRFYVVRVLGKSFVINAGALPNQRIIKTGIYRFIRHPAYAAELIGYAGISLVYNQVLSSICAFFLPLAGILIRIHIEEKALIAVLGDEYKDYRKKTKLFIPYLI